MAHIRPVLDRQRSKSVPPLGKIAGTGDEVHDAVDIVRSEQDKRVRPSTSCFNLCGQGAGGIDELRDNLDNSQIMWGLVRFYAGNGTLNQKYLVVIQFLGKDSSALLRHQVRGDLTSHALQVFGTVSRDLMFDDKEEVTLENLKNKLLVRECDAQWKAPRASFLSAPKELEDVPAIYRPQSGEAALQEISNEDGKWNWVLFGPDPKSMFIAGGADSVEGMIQALKDRPNQVLYGWIRLAFGDEDHRQVRLVFVHWGGPGVSPGTRFKHSLVKPAMLSKLDASAGLDFHTADELSLDSFLNSIADHARVFTREEFREEFKKARQVGPRPEPVGIQEAVDHVRNGPLDWLLLAPDPNWKRSLKGHKQQRDR